MTMNTWLQKRLNQTVTRKAFAGLNVYGDESWATAATTYKARVEGKLHLVKDRTGRDVMAQTVVYVGPSSTGGLPAFTVQDRITLPDATTPKILTVETLRDRTGTHHQAVHCG